MIGACMAQEVAVRCGRPRRQGVPRNASGRIAYGHDRERPEDAMAVVLLQPHRRGRQTFTYERKEIKPSDPLYGYAIGRLRVAGMGCRGDGISEEQFAAAETYGRLRIEWCHAKGVPIPNLPSPGMQMVAKGLSCSPEPDEDLIVKRLRAYGDARSKVIEYVGPKGAALLDRVVIQDYDPKDWTELGTVRTALNAVAHLHRR
jgi:hypothetical protein